MNDQYYNEQLNNIVPTQSFIVYLNKRYNEQGQITISDAVAALEIYKLEVTNQAYVRSDT